ncbi:MAG: ABC transporter substrate-binding protein [Erysipelothrix sp.]|nr:ABC transporter substrate-binding protein [Erysipelothrix sp.]
MKKLLSSLIVMLLLVGCSAKPVEDSVLNVGVSFFPMKDILILIEDDLKEAGIELKIHEFADYQTPNNLLKEKELDANMIQHKYFLEAFNTANDADLEVVLPIYHATFALYSQDYENLDEIPEGSSITLPDDATNLSRALYLLDQAGLIELDKTTPASVTVDDIVSNPKSLKFDDLVPLTSLAQRYTETKLAVMYPTYAKSLELVGDAERLYVEKQDAVTEDFAISLVARDDNAKDAKIEKLIELIKQDKVRDFLIKEYSWASKPAF